LGRLICEDKRLFIIDAADQNITVIMSDYKNKFIYKKNAAPEELDCKKLNVADFNNGKYAKWILRAKVDDNLFDPKLFVLSVNDTSIAKIDSISFSYGNARVFLILKQNGTTNLKAISNELNLEFETPFAVFEKRIVLLY